MQIHQSLSRKIIFVVLFSATIVLASISATRQIAAATSGPDENATIPPPGGTIPLNSAGIKLLHLAPFNTNTAVSAQIVAGDTTAQYGTLELGQSTNGYLNVAAGTVDISMNPAAGGGPFSLSSTVEANTDYTFALIGGAKGWPVEFLSLVDSTSRPNTFSGKVRVVHAAPFGTRPLGDTLPVNTQVSIVTQSGESVNGAFEGLLYRDSSPFVTLPHGNYDWKVILPTGAVLADLPPFTLRSEAVLTLYIVGDGIVQGAAGLLLISEVGNEVVLLYAPVIMSQ